jgi:hypothetical protein
MIKVIRVEFESTREFVVAQAKANFRNMQESLCQPTFLMLQRGNFINGDGTSLPKSDMSDNRMPTLSPI